jgi:hypothetical protein
MFLEFIYYYYAFAVREVACFIYLSSEKPIVYAFMIADMLV